MKNWIKIFMLTVVSFSFAAASYAQCHTVDVLNLTGQVFMIGGTTLFPTACPPGGSPVDHGPIVTIPGGTASFTAPVGQAIYRVGGMNLGDPSDYGSSTYPTWPAGPCPAVSTGPRTVVWVSESLGVCSTVIF